MGQVDATRPGAVLILSHPEDEGLAQAARGLAGGDEPAVGPLGGGVVRDQGQQEQQRGKHPDTVILLLRANMCLSVLFVEEEDTTLKHTIEMYNLDFFNLLFIQEKGFEI